MFFEEFELGSRFDIAPVLIEKQKMMDFALQYDHIPLHTDEEYARSTQFGDLIAPGVMSFMTLWSSYLKNDPIGTELIAGRSTKIEWLKPVYANDILSGHAVISKLTERNDKNGIVEITIYAYNQKDELVMTNVTEAVVKRR